MLMLGTLCGTLAHHLFVIFLYVADRTLRLVSVALPPVPIRTSLACISPSISRRFRLSAPSEVLSACGQFNMLRL